MMNDLPHASRPLVAFSTVLRLAGFPVSPEQTIAFLEAVSLVGPRSMEAVRHAGYACYAPRAERQGDFDALFRAHFYGDAAIVASPGPDEELSTDDDRDERALSPDEISQGESGSAACLQEMLFVRSFDSRDAKADMLRDMARRLPRRRSLRMRPRRRGSHIDMSRSLRRMVRNDGDIPAPAMRERRLTPRRILLLIDISGSMKQHTRDHLRLAHGLVHAAEAVEVFTLGTRLTRITRALAHREEDVALARVSALVADWDGGTRLGPVLSHFLREPRHGHHARGAAVLVLSDALERGDPAELIAATRRLSLSAWRLSWATPLAGDHRFRPQTAALQAMLPYLDDLVDGSGIAPLASFIQRLADPAPHAANVWRDRGAA